MLLAPDTMTNMGTSGNGALLIGGNSPFLIIMVGI